MWNRIYALLNSNKAVSGELLPEQLAILGRVNALLLKKQPKQAMELLLPLLEEMPKHPSILLARGDCERDCGHYELAIDLYKEAGKYEPRAGRSFIRIGEMQMSQGEYKQAERAFAVACRKEPKVIAHHMKRGDALMQQGWYLQAGRAYRQAIRLNMNEVNAHFSLGMASIQAGEINQAIGAFKFALGIRPDRLDIWRNLSLAYHKQERPKKVIQTLVSASQANPEDIEIRKYLAWMHREQGRADKSLEVLEELFELQQDKVSEDNSFWIDSAKSWDQLGYPLEALTALENVTESSDYREQAALRISLLNKSGQPEQAGEVCQSILQQYPQQQQFMREQAVAFACMGKHEQSIECFDQLLECYPDDVESLSLRVRMLFESGHSNEILLEACERFSQTGDPKRFQQIRIHFTRGMLLHRLGEFESAASAFTLGNQIKYQAISERVPESPLQVEPWLRNENPDVPSLKQTNAVSVPVFLVGLPGSGKARFFADVLQQLGAVASPQQGYLVEELECINTAVGQTGKVSADRLLRALDNGLSGRLKKAANTVANYCGTASLVVDLADDTALRISDISALYPDARFIYLQRNEDELVSELWCRFYASKHPWCHHPDTLLNHVHAYQQLMQHWMKIYPESMKTFDYQDWSKDPASTCTDLADWLELGPTSGMTPHPSAVAGMIYSPWKLYQLSDTDEDWGRYRHTIPSAEAFSG